MTSFVNNEEKPKILHSLPHIKICMKLQYSIENFESFEKSILKLHECIEKITGYHNAVILPKGNSVIEINLPARNAREGDRLKVLISEQIEGWKIIETGEYSLPTTF